MFPIYDIPHEEKTSYDPNLAPIFDIAEEISKTLNLTLSFNLFVDYLKNDYDSSVIVLSSNQEIINNTYHYDLLFDIEKNRYSFAGMNFVSKKLKVLTSRGLNENWSCYGNFNLNKAIQILKTEQISKNLLNPLGEVIINEKLYEFDPKRIIFRYDLTNTLQKVSIVHNYETIKKT